MTYVWGALAGLLWGALAGFLNAMISRRALGKNSTNALLCSNLIRTAVDLAALGAVFLARKLLPFSADAMLVATAISLSIVTMIFAFRLAGKEKKGK